MTTTERDRLLAFPGEDTTVDVRITRECWPCDWRVTASGSDENNVGAAAGKAHAAHVARCHDGEVGWIVVVDHAEPPLPRFIGPFLRRENATQWMETEVGAGAASWGVSPLSVPTPHDDKPATS